MKYIKNILLLIRNGKLLEYNPSLIKVRSQSSPSPREPFFTSGQISKRIEVLLQGIG